MAEYYEDIIGLDYETYSDVELGGKQARGLPNYIASPNFKPLCASLSYEGKEWTYDFVFNVIREDGRLIGGNCFDMFTYDLTRGDYRKPVIIAHNASFERAVSLWIEKGFDPYRIQDSAVDASVVGAERKLEVASRQLTGTAKLESGAELIQLFCVPNDSYPEGPTAELIKANGHMELWLEFLHYCEVDAKAGLEIRKAAREITERFHPGLLDLEQARENATWDMNQAGWAVDEELVEQFRVRSWANGIIAQREFQVEDEYGNSVQINFGSHQQLRKFCEARGVKYKSLDKYHLPGVLARVQKRIAKLEKDVGDGEYPTIRREIKRLREVEMLLETKAEIGGSTLSKLPVIQRLISEDGILRDQYMHVGASQTFRTTGRGVQMQNIAKLKMMKDDDGEEYVKDVSTAYDYTETWTNGDMAGQLRQVFRSRHKDGELLVGDFSGVESRGLAYEAGEEWKLEVFRKGRDVYKELVTRFIPGLAYEDVTPALRPRGKYSELSCGYQASGKAVQDFMFRLGFQISLEDATQNVTDWRGACPAIVDYWYTLDALLKDSVMSGMALEASIGNGLSVHVTPFALPSIQEVEPGAMSLCLQIKVKGQPYVTRFVHGAHFRGNKLCYYKPAKSLGPKGLWRVIDETRSAKKSAELGREVEIYYGIYGGKLAGIFTQSLCRELFFDSLMDLRENLRKNGVTNAVICGQFHDEINIDWWPQEGGHTKEAVMELMRESMTRVKVLKGFPLDVDIKSAYRYIK
ncbi:DNA polymerase I [Microbacterium phage CrunchyBoi]|nr:DNA polymerase I [Microbacterium phage CrunchyBoi]